MLLIKLDDPRSFVKEAEKNFVNKHEEYNDLCNRRLHQVCKKAINDVDFIKIMMFNNDYLGIAPIKTFLSYYECKLPKLTERKTEFVKELLDTLVDKIHIGQNMITS